MDEHDVKLNEVVLNAIGVYVTEELSHTAMFGLGHRVIPTVGDRIYLSVWGYIIGEHGTKFQIKYPRDWWQAVKERWFPEWLKKVFPVILTVHDLDPLTMYPYFKVSMPNEKHSVRIVEAKYDLDPKKKEED